MWLMAYEGETKAGARAPGVVKFDYEKRMDVRSRETEGQREQFGRVRVDRRPLIEFN